MGLFLIEVDTDATDRDAVAAKLDAASEAVRGAGADVLEATVTGDHAKAFVVLEAPDRDTAAAAAQATGLRFTGPDEVRLVGATVEEVRAARGDARYLVEWDFPEGLDMDTYLKRKAEKSPLYANVPEVSFLRTYVREDMSKCLCLYDATCEADVRRAREVVDTPISRLHELGRVDTPSHAG
jgi:hypothetical protein